MVVNNMKASLEILSRVIQRRLNQGEVFTDIVKGYSKLTKDEIKLIKEELKIK